MKFEEVLLALREGKKIKLRGCEEFEYLYKPKNETELRTEDYHTIQLSWKDFFSDNWEIVREPKKVKLRDLTEEQYKKWFRDNCRIYSNCKDCPFNKVNCFVVSDSLWLKHKDLYSNKFLYQEIEIEEE